MSSRATVLVVILAMEMLGAVAPASAQVLGVFRWQMQPYCNLVTFTIIQQGPTYQLTGSDNLCGAAQAAPATGTATFNPNGTVSFGFDIVVPSGAAAHVNATVNLSSVSGTWNDADGHTGTFAFNPPSPTGAPRPEPTRSVLITSAQLASSIFAGTGSATTLARSDHDHDNRYSAVEVIETPGTFQQTLTNEFAFTAASAETITSTIAGRWLISKTIHASLTCPSNIPLFFLLVDGVIVRSSVIPATSGTLTSVTMVGATTGTLAAGAHVVAFGADCFGQSATGASLTFATAATVTVVR